MAEITTTPSRFKGTGADGLTEQVRQLHGGERDSFVKYLFEGVSNLLLTRGVELKGRCAVCCYEWEPAGKYDPISFPVTDDGSLCAMGDRLKGLGIGLPRVLLLECPRCFEDDQNELFADAFGLSEPSGCSNP